jgi:prophage antirepressor-like protein
MNSAAIVVSGGSWFEFNGAVVRHILIDDEPWWFAKDVCESLGLDNTSEAVGSLDDEDKRRHTMSNPTSANPDVGAIPRTYVLVNEAGLYSLILKSRKPEAKDFKRWVTREVLPQIRRTGSYKAKTLRMAEDSERLAIMQDEYEAAKRLARSCGIDDDNQVLLAADNAMQKWYGVSILETLGRKQLPAANQNVHMTPTDIGKEIGKSASQTNKLLASHDLQFRHANGHWEATEEGRKYSVRLDTGKRHSNGTPITQLKWFSSVIELLRTA